MQKLLTANQMRDADVFTIKNLNITEIDLMENAAKAFCKLFIKKYPNQNLKISIFCGQGNNGGDGLAIARLLNRADYKNITVYLIQFSNKESDCYQKNLKRLKKIKIPITFIAKPEELGEISPEIIIDGILGSGLNQPLKGDFEKLVKLLNDLDAKVISIDVPTGFNSEKEIATKYNGIKASFVISFQRPKINFFFPESVVAIEQFKVVDIGLDENFIQSRESDWYLTTKKDIQNLIKIRKNFSHKGTYGHALIVAGNTTTMGAALLAANACLHSGAGLTTVCLPESGLIALNTALPEAMVLQRNKISLTKDLLDYTAFAIGSGLGIMNENKLWLEKIINIQKPLVIDADALNILSKNKNLLKKLAPNTILTPHIKEFERLFGKQKNWWESVQTARLKAQTLKVILILKNQYTFICLPTGEIFINSTGNSAMASGGMGDVLTGIIVALLAQNYPPAEAAKLGVYLHGKAGDELSKKFYTVTASQVAEQIPKTIKKILAERI